MISFSLFISIVLSVFHSFFSSFQTYSESLELAVVTTQLLNEIIRFHPPFFGVSAWDTIDISVAATFFLTDIYWNTIKILFEIVQNDYFKPLGSHPVLEEVLIVMTRRRLHMLGLAQGCETPNGGVDQLELIISSRHPCVLPASYRNWYYTISKPPPSSSNLREI